MRAILLLLVTFSTGALISQDKKVEETGKSPVVTKVSSGGRIRMELCSSGIELLGHEEDTLRVSYDPERGNVKVRIQVAGDQTELSVRDCPRNNFTLRVEVPKSTALYIRMFAGELNVRDVVGDKDVELHFGQLSMDVGKAEDYHRVSASVNSGELDAPAFNVSKGGLFRSFAQTGSGKYRLHAHVGAGELDLR
ncbi:MAG TPA: hypothetical protein VN708_07395 [Terriglobales bacterium]|jgi:hypothetical protein|nr:hypothetical protein [Terriglobales bacterium]